MLRPLIITAALALLAAAAPPARAETAPGLTPYARRVIERSRRAIEALPAEKGGFQFSDDVWHWLLTPMSAIFQTRDGNLTRTAEVPRLTERTACLDADLALLQHEMGRVRFLLKRAYREEKTVAIRRLTSLYDFLVDRYRELEWNGTKPAASDTLWPVPWSFDPKDTHEDLRKEKICAFSTKYADAGLSGSIGCTPDVLEEAVAMLQSIVKEITGESAKTPEELADLKGRLGAFQANLRATQKELDALRRLTTILGPGQGQGETGILQVEGCTEEWPPGFRTWSPGRFFEAPGARFLSLLQLLWNIELIRPTPFAPETLLTWVAGPRASNPDLARDRREFSMQQTRANALIRIGIVESEGIEEAFSPLTVTIEKLARLVREQSPVEGGTSLRDMTREAAYFLRRSCMNRDCNASLERVLKIISADACFPYTSGKGDIPADATAAERNKIIQKLKADCAREAGVDPSTL